MLTFVQEIDQSKVLIDSFRKYYFDFFRFEIPTAKSDLSWSKVLGNPVLKNVQQRNKKIEKYYPEISLWQKGVSNEAFSSWLQSHVHMISNRIFRLRPRLHEALLYSLLYFYTKENY